MPKVSEIFGGSHLKAEHLNGRPRHVTINGWNTEIVFGSEAYVVYFAEERRGLRLSGTCARDIATALKIDDMENWVGGKIELYPCEQKIIDRDTQTEKQITMIRARAPSSGPPATTLAPPPRPAPKPAPTARQTDLDDEIPF
jgi:hypothetical protein